MFSYQSRYVFLVIFFIYLRYYFPKEKFIKRITKIALITVKSQIPNSKFQIKHKTQVSNYKFLFRIKFQITKLKFSKFNGFLFLEFAFLDFGSYLEFGT